VSGLAELGGYAFAALAFGGWLYVGMEYFRAAKLGRFSVWRRKAGGSTWPPMRSESPLKFWAYWLVMASPYLIVSFLLFAMMLGLLLK
jgi:hypothetical protein